MFFISCLPSSFDLLLFVGDGEAIKSGGGGGGGGGGGIPKPPGGGGGGGGSRSPFPREGGGGGGGGGGRRDELGAPLSILLASIFLASLKIYLIAL